MLGHCCGWWLACLPLPPACSQSRAVPLRQPRHQGPQRAAPTSFCPPAPPGFPSRRTEGRNELRRQVGTLRFDINALADTLPKAAKKDVLAAKAEFLAAVDKLDFAMRKKNQVRLCSCAGVRVCGVGLRMRVCALACALACAYACACLYVCAHVSVCPNRLPNRGARLLRRRQKFSGRQKVGRCRQTSTRSPLLPSAG